MQRIEFPLSGNLRPNDILRTVYPDQDRCVVRSAKSAEGRSLFEIALNDYRPGCIQEVWNIAGDGGFIHRDWRDSLSLPNAYIKTAEDEEGRSWRQLFLVTQNGLQMEKVAHERFQAIFNSLLTSSHYSPASTQEYWEWSEDYKKWTRELNTPDPEENEPA